MVQKAESLENLLTNAPQNMTIGDNLIRAWSKINSAKYKKILCSISGGSDSDVVLDIIWKCDKENKAEYVWFDTGLEYEATKEHLKVLEEKYNIKISPYKAIKSIPKSCKEYGQPFISKRVSDYISRLQRHNFQWENQSYDELIKKYPRCQTALRWWCNAAKSKQFCITRNKWLKEFMIENPPRFKISNKCCEYAKKGVLHKLLREEGYDLNIFGVRKAEGGSRAVAYKSCFNEGDDGCDYYRPLFWYKDSDKADYENAYQIKHSDCYTVYGLPRTGCAGCPFGRDFENELEVIQKYEPKLYRAVKNIFGDSYEYTREYRKFIKKIEKNKRSKVMIFEPGNIVRVIDTYWHGRLNESRNEIGKLFVIKEVNGTQYGIINMETGTSSYWWNNSQLEFVSDGSLDEIKKCEKIRNDIKKRNNDLNYIKKEILKGNIMNLSPTSVLKLFHEIGYHSAFERNGEYYALAMDWLLLYPIFDALFNQKYDDMIRKLNAFFKKPYREEYKVKAIDLYNKVNQ